MASKKKVSKKKSRKRAKSAAKKKVLPIPAGYHTVTPYLVCRGAAGAIDFYKRAFGAKEKVRMPGPDGKVAHAELQIGDSRVMLGEEAPERGAKSPDMLGGSAVGVFLYVKNVDTFTDKAIAAGATVVEPVQDMFWGDRYGKLKDPFGHSWSVATHKEDLTAKQMAKRVQSAMSGSPG
jgi:PhnB protein